MSGQISVENLDYVRFILLLNQEGSGVVRMIVVNGLEKKGIDLSEFLSRNEEEIKKSKVINQEQKQILYPPSGQTADISNWDVSLLAFFARRFFTTSGSEDQRAVEKIKDWRNKYFHSVTTSVDDGDFEDLSNVIRTISHKYSPSEPPRIEDVINGIKGLELHPALEQLKALDLKLSERIEAMFGMINGHLVTLQRDVQQTYQEVRNMREELRRLIERDDSEAIQTVHTNLIPAEIMRMDKESIDLYKQLLNEGKEAVYNIRVMVVGPFGVGKTTLTKRLLREDVDLNLQDSTNGIDVHVRRCKVSISNGRWNILEKGKTSDATATRLVRLLNKHIEQKTIEKKEIEMPNWAVSTNSDSVEAEVRYERKKRSDSETNLIVGSNDQAIQTLESKDQAIQNELEDVINEVKSQSIDVTDTNSAHLSIWDFAGQYVFYSTHRVFLSERAIYLLVTDISKKVNEIVKDDSCVVDCNDDKKQWTVSEFVHFWLNSIHEFCSGQDNKGPPVLLVGTFADQLDKKAKRKRVEEYFRDLRVSVCGKSTFCHIDGNEDFDVDNSIIDNKIDQLRHTIFDIASKQSHWGEHIPAKWITLERKIVREKDLGKKVLYKNQLRDLNGELLVSIETDEELELFLRFHHESGNILYFSEAQLSDSIVLDPQWLIDAFKSIITEKKFYKRNQTILQNWLEFEKSAKLTDGFLDMVWEKSEFYEHKDLLLRYLQKLGFIVKPRQQSNSAKVKVGMVHNVHWDGKSDVDDVIMLASGTEKEMRFHHFHDTESQSTQLQKRIRLEQPEATDYYFVPCILKTPPKEELLASVNCGHQKSTSKLCFKTASGFLPTAVFNKLLAACISKWPLSESNNEYMLYCGFGVFDIEACHTLFVSFYDHEIQLWITNDQEPENDICANIYTFVHSFLQNDCGLSRDFKTFLRCPVASVRSNERRFSIDEVAKEKKVKCNCTSPNHVLLTENLTRYWFIEKSTDLIYDNDRELSEQDLTKIAGFIGRDWHILGSKLGLTKAEIEIIEQDNRNSVKQILEMLYKWRSNVSGEAANVQNLYKAMKSCNDKVTFEWKSILLVFNAT